MNDELADLGFGPLSFASEDDIVWHPNPKPSRYEKALRCRACGHFLAPHDVKGHDKWHKSNR